MRGLVGIICSLEKAAQAYNLALYTLMRVPFLENRRTVILYRFLVKSQIQATVLTLALLGDVANGVFLSPRLRTHNIIKLTVSRVVIRTGWTKFESLFRLNRWKKTKLGLGLSPTRVVTRHLQLTSFSLVCVQLGLSPYCKSEFN